MKTFLSVHQEDIIGQITMFDRMIFRGHLLSFFPKDAFLRFLLSQKILLKNFGWYVQTMTRILKGHVQRIGKLIDIGEFIAKSDFGDFKLDMEHVRKITFKDNAANSISEKALSPDSVIVLTNGQRKSVSDLYRAFSYYSTSGYIIGGSWRYDESKDIHFILGDSEQTVDFANIKIIQFRRDSKGLTGVAITLKNEKTASGSLAAGEGSIEGFTGHFANGKFYINVEDIDKVVFGATE